MNTLDSSYKLNEKKYKNAILYLAKKIGNGTVIGKKKFYKLFYFLDFDFFEKFDRPFTGEIYHKLRMGPAPSYFDAIVSEMQKEGILEILKKQNDNGYEDSFVYKAKKTADLTQFSEKELEILERVVRFYGHKSGGELEKITHKEAPYLAVTEGEEIPLELSHYRGTFDCN